MTTSTFDKDDLVLGIVALVCFSPPVVAWLVSIAEVSAACTSTVAVCDLSDGTTHEKGNDVNNKRRTSSKRHWWPLCRNIATPVRWVVLLGSILVVGIGGRDGATMANGVTMATRNHSSFFMALAFGIVFGGGLFALRRKVSLNLMVVVVETKIDKALMRNQNGSFFFLSPDCLLIPFVPLFFTHSWQ